MSLFPKSYETIVIGGGHAGIEASLASARMGCQTLLITLNVDCIGKMSCNPAIGGLAKGTLVREIDALGGEMGTNTDLCGIQFRMLNTRKGPAVRSPRAQCDRRAYQSRMKWVCERESLLDIIQANVIEIVCLNGCVHSVRTTIGIEFVTKSIVITTGTFLDGLMYIGREKEHGGRAGEQAAHGISASLRSLGLELGRLKTGTPPRILKRSVDLSHMQVQVGEEPVPYFTNWRSELFHMERYDQDRASEQAYPSGSMLARLGNQLPCYVTYTTSRTASIVLSSLDQSPLYSGIIKGVGPRYCPSIEDKILRFRERERHQVYLEPEGADTDELYLNGLSTSLPFAVQVELVRSITGCENAILMRPAYAVEYDFVYPTQLHATLETKTVRGLFLAGQINGTSGYEEAAAQGILAGINASRFVKLLEPIIIRRDQAYIGVLLDDLVTKGTSEPYRVFTSMAEHRLILRQDNADLRLSRIGFQVGLLSPSRFALVQSKQEAIGKEIARLSTTRLGTQTLAQILARPSVTYKDLPSRDDSLESEVIQQVEIEAKYAGYISRQIIDVKKLNGINLKGIPPHIDYDAIPNLSSEARQKLRRIKPSTIGQASRISGVSPADLSILMIWLKGQRASSSKNRTPFVRDASSRKQS